MFDTVNATLKPSKRLAALLVFAMSLALLGALVLPVLLWQKIAIGFVIMVYAVFVYRRYVSLSDKYSVLGLRISTQGHALRLKGSEEWISIDNITQAVIVPGFILVQMKAQTKRWPIRAYILRDSLDKIEFRRLTALLRWLPLQDDSGQKEKWH